MTKKKLRKHEPQPAKAYEVRGDGDGWGVVRVSDGARFTIACPASGRVDRSWSSSIDAQAWAQVLARPRFADCGAWELPTAGAEGSPAAADDDFADMADELEDFADAGSA